MHRFAIFITLMVLFCAVASSYSATIHVPSQQPTIQAGINAAVNGDTVLVAPGVYVEFLTIVEKAIVVRSSSGATSTFVHLPSVTVGWLSITESPGVTIKGFTFDGQNMSGAFFAQNAEVYYAENVFTRCVGSGNMFSGEGGRRVTFRKNVFRINYYTNAMLCFAGTTPVTAINNTIDSTNRAIAAYCSGSIVMNNIFTRCWDWAVYNNSANIVEAYNCYWQNTEDYILNPDAPTNVYSNPQFVDRSTGDYHLQLTSPCINAGNPDPQYNDPDESRNDIGAFSIARDPKTLYVPGNYSTIQTAMDSAVNGDTIRVAPGTYTGTGNIDLDPHGKSLRLVGSGAEVTTIDCTSDAQDHRGLRLQSGEEWFVIESLSVRNGNAPVSPWGRIGAVLLVDSAMQVDIRHCNLHALSGGAIAYIYYGKLTCENSVIECASGSGIAAWCSQFSLENVRISNCSVGLDDASESSNISDCRFVHNGVGANFTSGGKSITNCNFDSNSTIGAYSSFVVTVVDSCTFSNNGSSGAYYWENGNAMIIRNSKFHNNGSSGLLIDGEDNPNGFQVSRCHFDSNFGPIGGAIRLLYDLLVVNIDSCSFTNNSSPNGSALYSYSYATVNISSSLFTGNSGSDPFIMSESTITPSISCSNIFGNSGGDWVGDIANQFGVNGNISANPLFCDTANGDFHIAAESPCAPANNSCNQQIGAFGVACSVKPGVTAVGMENEALTNVLSPTPKIQWAVSQPVPSPQDSFLIAVGTDNDWQFAEKWNPASFASSDTFVTYDGSALLDGQTYYLRLRVHNTLAWSDWYQTSFRMNSVPSAPLLRAPINLAVVGSTPTLWITNGTDAQNDPLAYEFAGFHDTDCVSGPDINLTGVAQTSDSTGGQIVDPLAENCRYFWRARAFDGFEYSAWTDLTQFLVNGTPEAPTAPTLDYPPLPDNKPIFTLLPTLTWQPSNDPDPSDTVRYKLELSDRANFSFALVRDSLLATNLPLVDSLEFGTHYYWRVTSRDKTGLGAVSSVKEFWTWKLGDMNHSHSTDLSDLSLLIAYLVQTPRPDISPKMLADLTGDCKVDLSDLSLMISFMTTSGVQLQVGCE